MKNCCDTTTIIPTHCPTCDEFIDACCVIDASGISCLGISANTPQCDINRILAQAICDLTGSASCCPVWEDVTGFASSGDYTWAPSPSGEIGVIQTPQYTVPLDCNCKKVKLRGVLVGNWTSSQMLMFTLPAGTQPLNIRVYPTVVAKTGEKFYYPAFILIDNNYVFLQLLPATCCESNALQVGDELTVTLENIEFESI